MSTPFADIRPMLATGRRHADPPGAVVEFKWDGIRVLVETLSDRTVVRSRRGQVLTATFPELANVHETVGAGALLDGEVVAFTADGVPSFNRLQRRLGITDSVRAERARAAGPVAMIAFDLLAVDGDLLVDEPWRRRRGRLEQLRTPPVVQVAPVGDDVDSLLEVAAERGLEGCVIKDPEAPYEPGTRSRAWQKVRLVRRQELVVGGWKPASGGGTGRPGSLLVGHHDEQGLRFAGSVGSGLSERVADEWAQRLEGIGRDDSPFVDDVPLADVQWVDPVHVIDVQFREWTPEGRLRQPSYKGLRVDIDPGDVIREPDANA